MSVKTAVIVAPFWGQSEHVGVYRIDRFLRWFSSVGVRVVIVRAGVSDRREGKPWGTEITVRDPLRLYRNGAEARLSSIPPRKPNRARRMLAAAIFNPDPSVVWAMRAARIPLVLNECRGARWVLSSSPIESAHVGARKLASRLGGARFIMDMRDGWLDEPLKPRLARPGLRRWREGRLETTSLQDAAHIIVTSEVWRNLLTARFPCLAERTIVLPNCYPYGSPVGRIRLPIRPPGRALTLIYAGQFTGSRSTQEPDILLGPFCAAVPRTSRGTIRLLGNLNKGDVQSIERMIPALAASGWSLDIRPAVPREEMMRQLDDADGLLLLSEAHAAVPSKLYEYLPTGKPVFAVTPEGSAVWNILRPLPQAFLQGVPGKGLEAFLAACDSMLEDAVVPEEFGEEHLSIAFRKLVGEGRPLPDSTLDPR